MMSEIKTYITPNMVEVTINERDNKILCRKNTVPFNETEPYTELEYKYFEPISEGSKTSLGLRISPIIACFYSEKDTIDIIKMEYSKNNKIITSPEIVDEHKEIIKDKELCEQIKMYLNNDMLVYIQYIDSVKYKGYKISYLTDGNGVHQLIGNDCFIEYEMIEVLVTNGNQIPSETVGSLENIIYNVDDSGFITRLKLNYETCYNATKIENLWKYSNNFTNEEYNSIRNMSKSIAMVNNNILEIYVNNKPTEIRRQFINNGFHHIQNYAGMDINYILKQLVLLYDRDISILVDMLDTTPYKL